MTLPIQGINASSQLSDWFGVMGKLPLSLDGVVVPVAMVGNLSDEVYGPAAVGHIDVPAGGAGNRSEIEIALPAVGSASGAQVLLKRIIVQGLVAGASVQIGTSVGLPAPTHTGATVWRNTSTPGLPAVVINGKNDAAASALTVAMRFRLDLNRNEYVPMNWILAEAATTGVQQGLIIRAGADNQEIRCTFQWRERLPR